MDLWIRSQNKEKLIKVNNVCLGYAEKLNMYYLGVFYDDLQILGKYKTKERALEILNQIQDFISFAEFDNVSAGRYEEAQINAIRYLSRNLSKVGKVFYMPEE